MMYDMDRPPQKSNAREIMERAVEAGVGMLPVVGNPAAVAFASAMSWNFNKRMSAWFESLAEGVTALESRVDGLSFDKLADNDEFLDILVAATRAAQATSSKEKLDALRNGIVNSLLPNAPSLDEIHRFFRLVEQFTPSHLRLLSFLDHPHRFYDAAGVPEPSFYSAPRLALIEHLPEFAGNTDWIRLIEGDLAAANLTNGSGVTTTMTESGLWQPATSALGRRFIAFIHDPNTPEP